MSIKSNHLLYKEIKGINMRILRFSYAELDEKWKKKKFLNTTDRCYMILEGKGELWCNDEHIVMTPGNVYLIPAGTLLAFRCKKRLVKLYFHLNLYNSNSDVIPIVQSNCIVLQNKHELIREMTDLYLNGSDYLSAISLRNRAEALLLEAMRSDPMDRRIITHSPPVQEALYQINTNPRIDRTVEQLAKKIHSSPTALRTKFKQEIGTPIAKYQRAKVLQAVLSDLEQTKISLKSIAEKYGFCDQFYFSRLFSAHFGISPSKYRKEHII